MVDADAYVVHNVCGKMSNKRATSNEWHVFAETPEVCCKICQYVSRCKLWTWSNGANGHFKKCWITTGRSRAPRANDPAMIPIGTLFTDLEANGGFITGVNPGRLIVPGDYPWPGDPDFPPPRPEF
jgi:hypothetical protein